MVDSLQSTTVDALLGLLSQVSVGVLGNVDATEVVSSSVSPLLFFFGRIALMTFDAFCFRAPVIFVEPLVDPSDLCEAGMRVFFFFPFLLCLCMH